MGLVGCGVMKYWKVIILNNIIVLKYLIGKRLRRMRGGDEIGIS